MENKNITILQDVEKAVTEITKFDVTKQQLEEKVLESKKIVLDDPRDLGKLALIKRTRLDLRDYEINIEKQGKGFRDIGTRINRGIKEKENDLLAITGPEIERLKASEDEAERVRILDERTAKLPERIERIDAVGSMVEYDTNSLLELDDPQFEVYYNQHLQAKLEADKLEAERKRQEDEVKLEAERMKIANDAKEAQDKIDAENKRVADEIQAKQDEAQIKIDAENTKIASDRKKIEDDKIYLAQQKEVQEAEEKRLAKVEALKPDKEKLSAFADALTNVTLPVLQTEEANKILEASLTTLRDLAGYLKQ